jgi:hypothetical protein
MLSDHKRIFGNELEPAPDSDWNVVFVKLDDDVMHFFCAAKWTTVTKKVNLTIRWKTIIRSIQP